MEEGSEEIGVESVTEVDWLKEGAEDGVEVAVQQDTVVRGSVIEVEMTELAGEEVAVVVEEVRKEEDGGFGTKGIRMSEQGENLSLIPDMEKEGPLMNEYTSLMVYVAWQNMKLARELS